MPPRTKAILSIVVLLAAPQHLTHATSPSRDFFVGPHSTSWRTRLSGYLPFKLTLSQLRRNGRSHPLLTYRSDTKRLVLSPSYKDEGCPGQSPDQVRGRAR